MVIIPDLGDFCVNKIVISSHPSSSSLINRIKISTVRVAAIHYIKQNPFDSRPSLEILLEEIIIFSKKIQS